MLAMDKLHGNFPSFFETCKPFGFSTTCLIQYLEGSLKCQPSLLPICYRNNHSKGGNLMHLVVTCVTHYYHAPV